MIMPQSTKAATVTETASSTYRYMCGVMTPPVLSLPMPRIGIAKRVAKKVAGKKSMVMIAMVIIAKPSFAVDSAIRPESKDTWKAMAASSRAMRLASCS